VRRHE